MTSPTTASATKTDKIPVTMTDGTVVHFTPKQRVIRNSSIEGDQVSVRLDLRNGQTRTFVVPGSLLLQFAAHGAVQKLGDAVTSEPEDDDAVIALDNLIKQLNAGEWKAPSKAGEFAGTSILLRAMVEAFPNKTGDEVRAFLDGKSHAEKLALRKSNALAPIIARMEAEKAKKATSNINPEDLLAGFGESAPAPAAKSKAA